MRVMTLNLNGIRSANRKGFFSWLSQQNIDIVCLQEIRAHVTGADHHDDFFPSGFQCIYVDALTKGYSGVAIYSKLPWLNSSCVIGHPTMDQEGRFLRVDFADFSVISLYLPSGTSGHLRQSIKYQCLEFLTQQFMQLRQENREFIICGDINIAHQNIDLKNWRGNQKNSGFLPEERAWLDQLFGELGWIDAFRIINPELEAYTWWSNRGRAYEKNVGWRIDYQIVSPGFAGKIISSEIFRTPRFSDHAPLVIEYRT